jgi:hypothetical protein
MMTVTVMVAIAAFITAVAAGARPDWCPMWVSVVLASIAILLLVLPK